MRANNLAHISLHPSNMLRPSSSSRKLVRGGRQRDTARRRLSRRVRRTNLHSTASSTQPSPVTQTLKNLQYGDLHDTLDSCNTTSPIPSSHNRSPSPISGPLTRVRVHIESRLHRAGEGEVATIWARAIPSEIRVTNGDASLRHTHCITGPQAGPWTTK